MTAERAEKLILVIDDDATNLNFAIESLSGKGIEVVVARNGETGIKRAQFSHPDLILLDIMMPGIDGFETCRRLKAGDMTKDIPVIFMTALTNVEDKIKGFAAGGVDYITKPIQEEELFVRIKTHLTLRQVQQTLQRKNARLKQEITERRRTEESLQRLQKAIETSGIGITISDSEGKIIYTNPADAGMHGYRVDELLGQPSNIFTAPEYREERGEAGEPVEMFSNWERERPNMRKDGSIFPVKLTSNPIHDTQKFCIGTVTICEDITEQKKVEEELRDAKETAENANRAKSVFLANMSHELRTPLNAILGFAQIMARNPGLPPEERENLDIIQHSGEHLLLLINQVLDLSKIEAGRLSLNEEDFDLFALLDELEDMFRLRSESKRILLEFERSPDVPRYIRTDEVKLRQVLINVLNNAIKFTEEGGVRLEVTKVPEVPEVTKVGEVPEGVDMGRGEPYCPACNLLFTVSDTGPGIAREEFDSIFEAFTQTQTGRSIREGTGLGLAISYKFAHLMGGDLTVKSEPGRGATFTCAIQYKPAASKATGRTKIVRRVIAIEPGQPRYRILIADDKPDNRKLLVKFLQPFGFDLRESADGLETVSIWKAWKPHVIWMDMRMPVIDGYKATRIIRQLSRPRPGSSPRLPVIIAVTAGSFEEEHAMALSVGCDGFLRKPFRETDLFELLQKHLGVRFVYKDDAETETTEECPKEECLTPEALAALPAGILERLEYATIIADLIQLKAVATEIGFSNSALSERLVVLARNFDYQPILDALQQIHE